MGWTPHIIGYVSILRGSLPGIGSGNSTTKESRELTLPMQISPPAVALSNFTTTLNDSSALADRIPLTTNSYVDITLLGKPLAIDAIFDVIYAGMLYLSAWPQIQAIDKPGFIKDDVSRTILRWDSSHLTVYPSFEYKYAIAALVKLPACMYELNRFEDARFIVYVNEIEVGRGWLYRTGVGESM